MSRDEIIAANPIADFVRNRGDELKRVGENFVTNACPVTQHKNYHRPVTIDPEKNLWHCNDCKRGGTMIDWVMHEKNVTVPDAMRILGGGDNGAAEIVATYDYTDETGKLLFQCVRYQPKHFKQRQPDGKGGWIDNIKGVPRVLYRLPEVIRAQIVCVAEGEKDADNLRSLGFTATTNPMGAEKWRPEYSHTLRGKDVVIFGDVGDEDGQGERHTAQVIEALSSVAKSIKHVTLPSGFHDVSDYIASLKPDEATGAIAELADNTAILKAEKSWTDALAESVVTSRQLGVLTLSPRRKLLGDWLCEGDCGFIFASRGVGKTWFAAAMARTIAKGGRLGDWEACEPCRVLYIDTEMPADLMRARSIGLETDDNFQIINHEILFDRTGKILNIANPEIQNAITRHCANTGIKVLFIDNLSSAAFGLRENKADDWEAMLPWLLDLRRRKIAVVIVHHAGRSGEMRGTSKREDSVFWIIALDDTKENANDKRGARFISRFTKRSRNTQEEVPAYEWHFVTDNESGEVSISHRLAQTMDVFLRLIEDGVTECSEIAEEMKTSKASVSRMAKHAIKSKKIIKVGREYFLAEGAKNDPKP